MLGTTSAFRVRPLVALRLLAVLAFFALGCEPPVERAEPTATDAGTSDGGSPAITLPNHCVDGDGDGRGAFCPAGWDCDDNDPSRTDVCGVPTEGSGDACDGDPADAVECYGYPVLLEDDPSRVMCQHGTKRCLGGFWTSCIFESAERVRVRLLPLRRDGLEPAPCDNPCDPLCGRVIEVQDDNDFPGGMEEGDTWSNVDFYPELDPYGDGTEVPAVALAGTPNTSLPDGDNDGTSDCPDTDGMPSTIDCVWGDQCPMDRERDGFADGPDMDGDCIPDRCDARPDDAALPADRVPTIGGVRKWGCLDGYFWDGVACFTGTAAVDRADALSVPMCPRVPTSMTAQEMVHTLPYLDPTGEQDSLRIQVAVKTVDIYILFDNTGSMNDERETLRDSLASSIIPALRTTIPDAWFGLGAFQDFPDLNGASPLYAFGSVQDKPYQHILDVTRSTTAVDCALGRYTSAGLAACNAQIAACESDPSVCDNPWTAGGELRNCATSTGLGLETCGGWGGGSEPEAAMSAFQSAITGEEISRAGYPTDVVSRADSSRPACGLRRYGYPCFREDATPIFMVLTDSAIHNGPGVNVDPMTGMNDPTFGDIPVACCTSGQCTGGHVGAAAPTDENCAYPPGMNVEENFYTAARELLSVNARVATIWSGSCPLACREQCEAASINACDTCSQGLQYKVRCDRPRPNPNLCTRPQYDVPSSPYDSAAPGSCRTLPATCMSSAVSDTGFLGTRSDALCNATNGYSNTCFAGSNTSFGCTYNAMTGQTSCVRSCVWASGSGIADVASNRWRGLAGWSCPVQNPYTMADPPVMGAPTFARANSALPFFSYTGGCAVGDTSCVFPPHPDPVCANSASTTQGAQWYGARNFATTAAPIRAFCIPDAGGGCPAVTLDGTGTPSSWTDRYQGIPAACKTSGNTLRAAAPTQGPLVAHYRDGVAPALACTSPLNGIAFTSTTTDTAFKTLRIREGVAPASIPAINATNGVITLSDIACNPRVTTAVGGSSWTGKTIAAVAAAPTDCCVPGERRRNPNGTDRVLTRTQDCSMMLPGTSTDLSAPADSNGVVTKTVAACTSMTDECFLSGECPLCTNPGANGCLSCTFRVKYCVESCNTTISYSRRRVDCAPTTPLIECAYQERSASCAPQCEPQATEVCGCQRPASGFVDTPGTCTPPGADPTIDNTPLPSSAAITMAGGDPSRCAAVGPDDRIPCGPQSPLYCPTPNRVYAPPPPPTPYLRQARQPTSPLVVGQALANCSTSTTDPALLDNAYGSACGTSFNPRPTTPAALASPCTTTIPGSCTTSGLAQADAEYLPSLGGNYYCSDYWDGDGNPDNRVCAAGHFSDEAKQWRQLARVTNSLDIHGDPLIRQISPGGGNLDVSVVTAIQQLAEYIRQSITLRPIEVDEFLSPMHGGSLPPGAGHFVDNPTITETNFVVDIDLRTSLPESELTKLGFCGMESDPPNSQYSLTAPMMYRNCKPGTKTGFDVVLRNDIAPPLDTPQVFYFFIEVIAIPQSILPTLGGGPAGTQLALIPVTIVVPPSSHTFVESGFYERDFDFSSYCTDRLGAGTWRPQYRDMRWLPSPHPPQLAGTRITWDIWASNTPIAIPTPTSLPSVTFESPPTESHSAPYDLRSALVAQGISPLSPYMRVRTTLYSDALRTRSPYIENYEIRVDCMASD